MKKTILLTGANGFLGSHLLQAFTDEGFKVVILKRSNSNLWRIKHLASEIISYDIDIKPIKLAFEEQSKKGRAVETLVQTCLTSRPQGLLPHFDPVEHRE